ncbi:unnamed protein product [Meloidogyne enterolobii]
MVPIEKRSLSCGAMLNKFEKDFMIFPEYLELAEIVNIKSYVGKLGDDLDKTSIFNFLKFTVYFLKKVFGG